MHFWNQAFVSVNNKGSLGLELVTWFLLLTLLSRASPPWSYFKTWSHHSTFSFTCELVDYLQRKIIFAKKRRALKSFRWLEPLLIIRVVFREKLLCLSDNTKNLVQSDYIRPISRKRFYCKLHSIFSIFSFFNYSWHTILYSGLQPSD